MLIFWLGIIFEIFTLHTHKLIYIFNSNLLKNVYFVAQQFTRRLGV
jgi:hypothetical protein